ncbi:MAG: hypothetical protein JWP57_933, partial [Spirosoma sp.]|nr:hypothetical protein [Spirosoma sp.]
MRFRPALQYRSFLLLSVVTGVFGAALWLTACHSEVDKPADIVAAEAKLPQKVDY